MKPADVYQQVCEMYGEHAVSESMVQRWTKNFNNSCESVHDDSQAGRSSVVTDLSGCGKGL